MDFSCTEKNIFLKFTESLKLASLRNPALYGNREGYLKLRITDVLQQELHKHQEKKLL